MRISLPFLALLGLSVAVGAEANLVLAPATKLSSVAALVRGAASSSAAQTSPFRPDAWWLGFHDETLNALILAARQYDGGAPDAMATQRVAGDALALPVEMQVAAAYVSAKVDGIGADLIREAITAMRREAELMNSAGLSDRDRSVLQQRMADATAAERTLTERRATLLALLAAGCGINATALEDLVAPPGSPQPLPLFNASLPAQAPVEWVFERQDVLLAQALRAIAAQSRMRRDDGYVDSLVQRAQAEVDAALSELQEQRAEAVVLEARAQAVRQALDEALLRRQNGSGSEGNVLERYQQLLLYSQQFSSATGTLALGWIKLLYRLQGALGSTADGAAWPTLPPAPSHGTLQRPLI